MRERKRSDYDPINWRYRAEIIGPLPEIIMQTGRKMDRLWNELVAIHNRTPYRLLRSVEGTFRDLARSARMDAGCARERGDEETAYSSRICHKCKGEVEASADLIVRCTRCKTPFDQDKNTVRYFWNNYDAETRAVARPLASVNRSILEKVWRVVSA